MGSRRVTEDDKAEVRRKWANMKYAQAKAERDAMRGRGVEWRCPSCGGKIAAGVRKCVACECIKKLEGTA
jgi:PHP family Zn ribbon phosphoesterase